MKRLIAVGCLSVVLASSAVSAASPWITGFGGGASMGLLSIAGTEATDYRMGVGIGGGLSLKRLYAGPEPLVVIVNPKVGLYCRWLGSYSETTVSVPIMVLFPLAMKFPFFYSIGAGVQVDIPFNANVGGYGVIERVPVDVGIAVGVAVSMLVLDLDFRYVMNINQPIGKGAATGSMVGKRASRHCFYIGFALYPAIGLNI